MKINAARRTYSLLTLVLACLSALGFCAAFGAQQPGQDAQPNYDALAQAPERDRARINPFASDPRAVAAGRKLFAQHCAACHGQMGEGAKKGPSLQADPVAQATPGTLFWILTNGVVRRGMPVWSKLPEAQRWQIIVFLKSWQTASEASRRSPPA